MTVREMKNTQQVVTKYLIDLEKVAFVVPT